MPEQSKAMAKRFYEEVFNKKNVNAIDELCTANFVNHAPMPGTEPGLKGVKQMFTMMFTAFPDFKLNVEEMVEERDIVVTRFSATATHKGDMMGAKPTGKKVTFHGMDMFKIKNGKATEIWQHGDEMLALAQIGVKPPA